MKKCFGFVILLVLCLLIGGCGSKTAYNLDMDKAIKQLDEKFTNMEIIQDNELDAVYGVDVSLSKEYVVKASTLNNGNLYAIFKVDKSNESELKKQMSNMFSILEKNSNLYSPETVKLIKNHFEICVGDYLIYIVSSNNDEMYEIIKGNMS